MEMTHSNVGASSCERWWNCPGSVKLIETLPPQPPSEYAQAGTIAHSLAEFALRKNVDALKASMAEDYEYRESELVPMEMIDAVQVYLDVIDEDVLKYGCKKSDLEIEKQFQLVHIHPDARGTNDANLGVFLQKLIVYDFKYGKGVAVEAEENKQAMYYALGAAQEGDYDTIEIVIVQPRAIHRDGPVRRWTVSKSDLLAFGRELADRIKATEIQGAQLVCGNHCQKYFCPAIAICPAVRGRVQDVAAAAFSEPVGTLPSPEHLSRPTLIKLLDTIPIIDAYIKAVEAFALTTLNNGGTIQGYKLVAKRSNRQWKDEVVVKAKWPKIAVRMVEEVLSPSQMEKELKAIMTLKDAKKMIEDFTYKPEAGTAIVPENDPREAVRPKLESVFSDVKNDDLFS